MQENLFQYTEKGLQGEKITSGKKNLALVPSLYDGSVALSVGKRGIKATLSLLKHKGVE